jgi:tetratricopeptide (TPR) repeat protein
VEGILGETLPRNRHRIYNLAPKTVTALIKIVSAGWLLLTVVVFGQASASEADSYSSKANLSFAVGDYEGAAKYFLEAIKEEPGNPGLYLNLAVAYFKLARFAQALNVLEVAHKADPSNPLIYYYQGEAHFGLGNYERVPPLMHKAREMGAPSDFAAASHYYAGEAFVRLEEYTRAKQQYEAAIKGSPDSDFAQRSQQTLELIAKAKRPWHVSLSTGIEYDDNVVLTGESDALDPRIGISNRPDFRNTIFFWGEYAPFFTDKSRVSLDYSLYQSLQHKINRFDRQIHNISARTSHRIRKLRLHFDYTAEFDYLGGEKFLQRHLVTPGLDVRLTPFTLSALRYEHRWIDRFDDSERDGRNDAVAMNQYFYFSNNTRVLLLRYRFERESTKGDNFDFHGHDLLVQFTSPVLWNIEANALFNYRLVSYDHIDTRFPDEHKRLRERQRNYSVSLARKMGEHFTLSIHYRRVVNGANINVFEYKQNVVGFTLGLQY